MENVPKSEENQVLVQADGEKALGGAARGGGDRELVRRAQHGDKEAFEVLVQKHQAKILAVAGGILHSREDIEDIAQQVFLKAYFSLKKFDQRSAFSTWLYRITVNECWDLLRKRKVRPLVFESELTEEQAQRYSLAEEKAEVVADASDQLAVREQLDYWLECLEEHDREMLILKEVQGFTVEEIAEMMEINGNTVKVRLFRARQKIAEKLRRKKAAKA